MAGEFARDNGAALEAKLGRAAGATDLYMAHFLGAGGASKFLGAMQKAPDTAAAALFPAAAAANRRVFYAADGAARSLAQVYARFEAKLSVGDRPSVTDPSPRSRLTLAGRPLRRGRGKVCRASGTSLPVSQARLAYMLLAELGG